MLANQRILLRAAERIHRIWCGLRAAPVSSCFPKPSGPTARRCCARFICADSRGWTPAASFLQDRLERAVSRCSERFWKSAGSLASRAAMSSSRRPGDLSRSGCPGRRVQRCLDRRAKPDVSVTTEPIVLEEIGLGPFEIRLHWDRIGDRHPYEVVALDPNPARESSDTTHPHVKDEQLCEGDGRPPIERALRAAGCSTSFNREPNPLHLQLRQRLRFAVGMGRIPCSDCGDIVSDDDRYDCDRCDDTLCRDCLISCARCDELCCQACTELLSRVRGTDLFGLPAGLRRLRTSLVRRLSFRNRPLRGVPGGTTCGIS